MPMGAFLTMPVGEAVRLVAESHEEKKGRGIMRERHGLRRTGGKELFFAFCEGNDGDRTCKVLPYVQCRGKLPLSSVDDDEVGSAGERPVGFLPAPRRFLFLVREMAEAASQNLADGGAIIDGALLHRADYEGAVVGVLRFSASQDDHTSHRFRSAEVTDVVSLDATRGAGEAESVLQAAEGRRRIFLPLLPFLRFLPRLLRCVLLRELQQAVSLSALRRDDAHGASSLFREPLREGAFSFHVHGEEDLPRDVPVFPVILGQELFEDVRWSVRLSFECEADVPNDASMSLEEDDHMRAPRAERHAENIPLLVTGVRREHAAARCLLQRRERIPHACRLFEFSLRRRCGHAIVEELPCFSLFSAEEARDLFHSSAVLFPAHHSRAESAAAADLVFEARHGIHECRFRALIQHVQ